MTLLALLLVTGAHLAAWVGLFRFVTPRWRVALALLLPPLVALHWWERAESTDARERRQALWSSARGSARSCSTCCGPE